MIDTTVVADVPTPTWRVTGRDRAAESELMASLGVSSVVAAVLVSRGMSDPEAAERFLNPSLDHLHDPKLLPDFDKAVKAILNAKDLGHTIYVHGDYDVDGVTSTALFTRFLQRIGCNVVPHVPHRTKEGYGIHLDAIQWAKDKGTDLFLTCDCGISAHRQVEAATSLGMEVVVTDHHMVGETMPNALAIVNPHRSDSIYPWPELAGVGVAFKLCAGLTQELGHKVEQFYRAYLDLAVLGTVADVMPLLDENRVITKFGLEQLRDTRKTGLQALLRVSDLVKQPKLTARHVGYQLGPRINAVGRIQDSATALDLMLTDDPAEAARMAAILDHVNEERRAEQTRSVEEAMTMVEAEGLGDAFTLLLADPSWHAGLIGLIAGRLVEKFRRPAFVLTIADGVAKGSARSIPGFDLGEAVRATKSLLIGGGGHEMAAGVSMDPANIGDFKIAIETLARASLTPEDLRERIDIDVELEAREATPAAYGDLLQLEPYGNANRTPVFAVRGVKLASVVPTANPEHARVICETDDGLRSGMAFRIGHQLASMSPGSMVDVAFTIDENVFNGQSTVRWTILDVQPSSS